MPKIALQLYTVRDFAEKDLKGTLKRVKEMGFDLVELAGTYGLETSEFKNLLDEVGLKAISAHVSIGELQKDPTAAVKKYKELGVHAIGIPALSTDRLPGGSDFEATKELIIKIGEICKENDIVLMYHNHAFEFEKLPSGEYIFDALFKEIPILKVELDIGWVKAAGLSQTEYVKAYRGRLPVVHFKDTVKIGDKYEDRPVGQGEAEIEAIIELTKDDSKLYVVELDMAVGMTSMEAAEKSREYLKGLGY